MSMDPNPTSGEMLALALDTSIPGAPGRRRQAYDTGLRLLSSLPRLTGLGERLTIRLTTTPAGDLKIQAQPEKMHLSCEISRRPSWPQIEKMYIELADGLCDRIVSARARMHREKTGIDPAWSYKADILLRGVIHAAGITPQEYHEWVSGHPDVHDIGDAMHIGTPPSSPLFTPSRHPLRERPGMPVHRIRPRLFCREYRLDYWGLSPDVWWTTALPGKKAGMVLMGSALPETMRQAVEGRPLSEVIGHAGLDDERLRIVAVQKRGKSTVLRIDPVTDWMDALPRDVQETLDEVRSGIRILIDHHRPDWARDAA